MGQPGWSNVQSFPYESIVRVKETRGTETSKYPEEEKETSIPKVAASEMGRAQTEDLSSGLWTLKTRSQYSGSGLERPAAEGKSPVREMLARQSVSRVPPDT